VSGQQLTDGPFVCRGYMYMHAYIHTCTHIYAYTCIHTQGLQASSDNPSYVVVMCICMYTYTYIHKACKEAVGGGQLTEEPFACRVQGSETRERERECVCVMCVMCAPHNAITTYTPSCDNSRRNPSYVVIWRRGRVPQDDSMLPRLRQRGSSAPPPVLRAHTAICAAVGAVAVHV
jgi:hypothetical protein